MPAGQKFMQPAAAPGLPSNEALIKQANENYGRFFKAFITKEKINLELRRDHWPGVRQRRPANMHPEQERSAVSPSSQAWSQFRPQFTGSRALPSSAARPGIMGGKIGPGLKVAGGIGAMLALQFLAEFIWAKLLAKMLQDEMKKLEPTISAEVSSRIQEIAELLSNGKRAYAVVAVDHGRIVRFTEGGSAPLPPKVEFLQMRLATTRKRWTGRRLQGGGARKSPTTMLPILSR